MRGSSLASGFPASRIRIPTTPIHTPIPPTGTRTRRRIPTTDRTPSRLPAGMPATGSGDRTRRGNPSGSGSHRTCNEDARSPPRRRRRAPRLRAAAPRRTAPPPPSPPPPPPPPQSAYQSSYPPSAYPPPRVIDPNPPPLSPMMRAIYAPFYVTGLVLRYGIYYT